MASKKKSVSKKKPVSKAKPKKVVVKASTKGVKRQLKSISKRLETSKAQTSRSDRKLKAAVAKNTKASKKIEAELAKLRLDLKKSKGKKNKKQLNEYNLFMRRQLLKGKTFNQAVKLWQKLRNVEEGKMPTKTRIKTVVKRVRSKPKIVVKRVRVKSKPKIVVRRIRVKSKPQIVVRRIRVKSKPKRRVRRVKSKPKTRVRTRTVVKTKTIVRRAKPIVKYKTRTKTVEKPIIRTIEKPVFHTVEKPVFDSAALELLASTVATETAQKVGRWATSVSRTESSVSGSSLDLPSEEIAYRMVKVYFEELARTGFKRQMSLDDLVDAFVYSWYRVEKHVGRKMQRVHNEEIAYRLVNLYFIELARIGEKRTLNLDELLNAYFYVLERLGKDNTELIRRMEAAKTTTTQVVTTTTQTQKTESSVQ